MSDTHTEGQEAAIIRLAALQAQRETITAEIQELTATLVQGRANGDRLTVQGQPIYKVVKGRRWSPKVAAEVLSPAQLAACSTMQLDRARAQQVLGADEFDACKVETAPYLQAIQ